MTQTKIVAIANEKGGVAKTTSTIALGGLIGQKASCLVVDFDPQGHLTLGLGVDVTQCEYQVYHVLVGQEDSSGERCSVETLKAAVATQYNVKLLATNKRLAVAEDMIRNEPGSFMLLKEKLAEVRDVFRYILIDCPPSVGLLTTNALTAADYLLIPVQCQPWALDGMDRLLETASTVKRRMNPQLSILGILPTMRENTVVTKQVLEELHTRKLPVFEPVPKSTEFAESTIAQMPIGAYTKKQQLVRPYKDVVKALMAANQS